MPLPDREQEVLTTIIEAYIVTAAPVGSRTVSKQSHLGLSPASIRNIMADLTDDGYLEQPHTSAGRVPTAKAFRLYLDGVMRVRPLAESQKERIATILSSAGLELSNILHQTSRLLSGLSLQVAMVVAPRHADTRWKRIDFSLLNPGLVMVILVLQGGLVRNRVIETDAKVTADDLITYANYLNDLFTDHTVAEVRARIENELREAERTLNALYQQALMLARSAFERGAVTDNEIIVDGTLNILSQPEFTDSDHVRDVMRVLEERTFLLELLDKATSDWKTVVTIGGESDLTSLSDLGIITAPYGTGPLGAIGLIGPVRMDYATLVPVVNFTANALTRILDRHF